MNISEAIQKRVLDLCEEKNITPTQLRKTSKIPYTTFYRITHADAPALCISTVDQLCDGLGISLADFFAHDVFRNIEQS